MTTSIASTTRIGSGKRIGTKVITRSGALRVRVPQQRRRPQHRSQWIATLIGKEGICAAGSNASIQIGPTSINGIVERFHDFPVAQKLHQSRFPLTQIFTRGSSSAIIAFPSSHSGFQWNLTPNVVERGSTPLVFNFPRCKRTQLDYKRHLTASDI